MELAAVRMPMALCNEIHEKRWTYDRATDTYYRIDTWVRDSVGDIRPVNYEDVPEGRVPPDRRRNTLGLKYL